MLEYIYPIQQSIRIRHNIVTLGEFFGTCWAIRQDERSNCDRKISRLAKPFHVLWIQEHTNSLLPLASAGAYAGQIEHNWEEHGISCLRYNSRTIFWTLPLFVDLMKTLLDTFCACGLEEKSLRRLFILASYCSGFRAPPGCVFGIVELKLQQMFCQCLMQRIRRG